jgi:acetate---CoA ligase (ADP-forming)
LFAPPKKGVDARHEAGHDKMESGRKKGRGVVPDISKLLSPQSLAVVGASSDIQGLRGRILEIILSHPYEGKVYPVSRSAAEVQGLKAYPSIEALPEVVDLAILIVPAQYIPAELERCGRAGIKAAVILSSGFAEEPGGAGARMQAEIGAIARRYDMAVSGPNSEGFANIAAALCPTFSPALDRNAGPITPKRALGSGQVSVISQSGGLGFAFFDRARQRNLSFRHIVTTGNEVALEAFDFVDYMLDEGKTDVFLLLLEEIKSPDKFKRIAEKALKAGKPLIVGKIGQSEPGGRAVHSHTAALAGSQASYRAMFERYGLIEARDFDEMLDIATGFLACGDRLPNGDNVAVCTSSGGAGVWMADACAAAGLAVPLLDDATRKAIDRHIPSYGTSQNPIDSTAQGVHKLGYAAFAQMAAQSPLIDSVIVVVTARRSAFLEGDLQKLKDLRRDSNKPVLMWTYTLPSDRSVEILNEAGYPLFTGAHGCARTLRALADYRAMREILLKPVAAARTNSTVRDKVRALLTEAGPVLSEWQARPLLAAYGIGGDAGTLARSADEAVVAAQAMRCPVALKIQSAAIAHKTEAGGVVLNLTGADAVQAAYDRVIAGARKHSSNAVIDGVLVQPMAASGREVILGIKRDERWGPMLMVGLGGLLVEALGDVVLAPCPIDRDAAIVMVERLKGAQIFRAFRGMRPADVGALADLMVKLSQFAADHADTVAEIDLNPVIVHDEERGLTVVDALIVKHAPEQSRAAAE